MTILKIIRFVRRYQYGSARRLGDVQAVLTGRIFHRIAERKLGKLTRRQLNQLLKGIK